MAVAKALEGRSAIVTGAASGIGAAIAEAYAEEGARLFLVDLDGDRLEEVADRLGTGSTELSTMPVDVTDPEQTKAMVDRCAADLGSVDVLVNSAGILDEAPLVDMDVETWDRMIAVDLRGVFLCCRWAAPLMVAQGSGRIINIASQLGIKGGEGLVHYCAAKAGVIGLTKALARELAPHGVLVNAIAPGPIETTLVGGLNAQWRAAKEAELPLRRFGTVAEVAPSAVLLASDPGGNLYVGQGDRPELWGRDAMKAAVPWPGRHPHRRGSRAGDRFLSRISKFAADPGYRDRNGIAMGRSGAPVAPRNRRHAPMKQNS